MPDMAQNLLHWFSPSKIALDLPGFTAVLLLGLSVAFAVFKLWSNLWLFGSGRLEGAPGVKASSKESVEGSDVDVDLNKGREPGEWNPVKFNYPSVEPSPYRISEIKPIPYRPFRWGAYHVTMGIRSMPWSDWIELDKGHAKYHEIKAHRMKIRGRAAVRVMDDQEIVKGGSEAAVELVHELAEYLSRRYPSDFSVTRHPSSSSNASPDQAFCDWGWDAQPPIKSITITALKEKDASYDLPLSINDGEGAAERAMQIAGLLIQDDLALMIEGLDGRYYFQAGSICLPGFWRMQDKIGLPLDDIHISGKVPQYKEKLQTSLERFFRRLPVDKPVIRNNYFIQVNRRPEGGGGGAHERVVDTEELGWAESTLGPEETYEHGSMRPPNGLTNSGGEGGAIAIERIRLRTERQTLRRLPRSGAVVFTIRTYLTPVTELGRERGVAGRMASALRSWPEDVGEYKGKQRGGWYEGLLEYLDLCHGSQGAIGAEEEKGYPM
ncbi:hypothetical protein CVT26_010967 [Gymnopilus dilepis]|uniref:Uncharacterized protein n=1 Tax=Gymnopilus dilepis TaxID=231916 RepID=A0A409VJ69_9AGAR|nr:hypothetical protein CVT26_010967 [Gymnopilus dilepis]